MSQSSPWALLRWAKKKWYSQLKPYFAFKAFSVHLYMKTNQPHQTQFLLPNFTFALHRLRSLLWLAQIITQTQPISGHRSKMGWGGVGWGCWFGVENRSSTHIQPLQHLPHMSCTQDKVPNCQNSYSLWCMFQRLTQVPPAVPQILPGALPRH